MAIMQGITGKLSGKMGSAVFRVREGAQVVAQYNPVVKNPNSEGQQSSRAAFKLMSQLAAVMGPGFGTMSVTPRSGRGTPSKRNAFFKLNYGLVTTAETALGVVASIPMDQLKLTSSFRELGTMSLTDSGSGELSVQINNVPAEVASARLVLVGYGVTNGIKQARIIQMVDVPKASNRVDHDFELPAGDYTVLAYGLIPTETTAGKINLDNLHTPADEDFVSAVELNELVAAGDLVETMTIGANVATTVA